LKLVERGVNQSRACLLACTTHTSERVRLFTLAALYVCWSSSEDEDDDDDDGEWDGATTTIEDVSSSLAPLDANRQRAFSKDRKGFVRTKPRFPEREGHARWYGEWGAGAWGEYARRETVNDRPALRDEFEERFRIPHDLFCEFEDEMAAAGVFEKRSDKKRVPPRVLLMASFKRLASGARWAIIAECAFVSAPVLREFFARKFVPYFANDAYYSTHVYYPKTVDGIRATERAYRAQGLPGCVGSVDVVHMPWDAAPAAINRMFYNGRKGVATYASVVTVDSDCVVLHATDAGPGASSDATLPYHDALQTNALYSDYEYELLDASGNTVATKGVYTICDCTLNTHCAMMAAIGAPKVEEMAWNERVESVRKDVETCFERLKKRFQILRILSLVRDFEQIKDTWRTCLVLHNILARRRSSRDDAASADAFDAQDAAAVQAWYERDVEDAEYYAHRLAERRDENAYRALDDVDDADDASDLRIARAHMLRRMSTHLAVRSVESLDAYRARRDGLIAHHDTLARALLARGFPSSTRIV